MAILSLSWIVERVTSTVDFETQQQMRAAAEELDWVVGEILKTSNGKPTKSSTLKRSMEDDNELSASAK
jgi:hypothetical protein